MATRDASKEKLELDHLQYEDWKFYRMIAEGRIKMHVAEIS